VQVGSVAFSTSLSGSGGTSINSSEFATLQASKSYVFDVVIWGSSTGSTQHIEFSIAAIGQSPTISSYWITSSANAFRSGTPQAERSIYARVVVNGTSTTANYQLKVRITAGFPIDASEAITFSGGFTGLLVGSVN
jgi:hypothetical protein